MEQLATAAGVDEPNLLARELMLLMEGAYVTHHVTGDEDGCRRARGIARLLIEHRLSGASS